MDGYGKQNKKLIGIMDTTSRSTERTRRATKHGDVLDTHWSRSGKAVTGRLLTDHPDPKEPWAPEVPDCR